MKGTNIKPKIYIDQGHNFSGVGTGAVGNGMREQDITFYVGYILKQKLGHNFDVKLSRHTLETNIGHDRASAINNRWREANDWGADYFISLHTNAATNENATGAETFYFRYGSQRSIKSQAFAQIINDTYVKETGLRDRGVKPDTLTAIGSIGVLRHTKMPAVLVELAFISSSPYLLDIDILKNYEGMANALVKGIFAYFKVDIWQTQRLGSADDECIFSHTEPAERSTVSFELLGKTLIEVDGYIENGTTMVAARQLLEALGYQVELNSAKGVVLVKTDMTSNVRKVSEEDQHALEQLVHFEARGESEEGQMAVVHVIMNRLLEVERPNTIKGVIEERTYDEQGNIISVQFSPTLNPEFGITEVSQSIRQVVKKALDTSSVVGNATFFHAIDRLVDTSFHVRAEKNGIIGHVRDIGNHRFWEHITNL
jgi:N-acetylmuramoyl-L-alanine amidase